MLAFLTWKSRGQSMHKAAGCVVRYASCPGPNMPFSQLSWPAATIAAWEVTSEHTGMLEREQCQAICYSHYSNTLSPKYIIFH